jgi:hypothetical protein
VHDFVLWGFNEAERSPGAMHDRRADNDHQDDRNRRDNEKVFDGVLNWIGATRWRAAGTRRRHFAKSNPSVRRSANETLWLRSKGGLAEGANLEVCYHDSMDGRHLGDEIRMKETMLWFPHRPAEHHVPGIVDQHILHADFIA